MLKALRKILSGQCCQYARLYGTKSRGRFNAARLQALRTNSACGIDLGDRLSLSNLYRSPRSNRKKTRVRGPATGSKRHGRGSEGQNSRSGSGVPRAFEGGQTPLYRRIPKMGFKNHFAPELTPICLSRIAHWIETGRLDPNRTITIRSIRNAGQKGIKDGVKILGRGADLFKYKINIEATQFSDLAIRHIEKLGGTATAIHYTRLGLRSLFLPQNIIAKKFKVRLSIHERYLNLLKRKVPVSHQVLNESAEDPNFELPRVSPPTPESTVDVFIPQKEVKSFHGCIDPLHPDTKFHSKQEIETVLKTPGRSFLKLKMLDLLPRFAGPAKKRQIDYYSSSEKRGYLSPLMMERLGEKLMNLEYPDVIPSLSMSDLSLLKSLYTRLAMNYWISRRHVIVVNRPELYTDILQEQGLPLPDTKLHSNLKQETTAAPPVDDEEVNGQFIPHKDFVKEATTSYAKSVSKTLTEKGLRYYKGTFKSKKERRYNRKYPVRFLKIPPSTITTTTTTPASSINTSSSSTSTSPTQPQQAHI